MIFKVLTAVLLLTVGTQAQFMPILPQITLLRSQITACNGMFVCGVTQTASACTVTCINADLVCDGTRQCTNGVDEHDCPRMCEGLVICADKKTCAKPCDGITTCPGMEDEQNCPPKCKKTELLCSDRTTCATPCNGVNECTVAGVVEDETNCAPTCLATQVLCNDGVTCSIPCDGTIQCTGGSDEHNCPFQCRCTAGQYICLASKKCLARADVCEGETPGADLIADSCFTGTETGDDEDNNGFGVQCTA